MRRDDIRNIAIIAHVDHGKTTLVDGFLEASKVLTGEHQEAFLDSNPLERERGITILAKNVSIRHNGIKINLIDTPGHADFGGEVERVLKMADGCLLLVDAAEGPMPQTKFVLSKALSLRLSPIVILNKIDRPDARPEDVVQFIYDLFIDLGADDKQIAFPVLYASGRNRISGPSPDKLVNTLTPILDQMIKSVPGPEVQPDRPLQVMITNFQFDEYVGRIGIGRIVAGTAKSKMQVAVVKMADGAVKKGVIKRLDVFEGLGRIEVQEAAAGDIVAIIGIEGVDIGDTITDPDFPVPLPAIEVDEPTVNMEFAVNDSPFGGREGEYVTSRQIRDRLHKAKEADVALRVAPGDSTDSFRVSGRGILHLGILIENMRREGYEFAVSSPEVIFKVIDGRKCEPVESVAVDLPAELTGKAIELLGNARGELLSVENHGKRAILRFMVPSRGLIGMRSRMLMATQGEAVFTHRFERYEPYKGDMPARLRGAIINTEGGQITTFALTNLSDRGTFFVRPGDPVYAGMVVGENNREDDIVVNAVKEKALNNIRSANKEATVTLKAPREMSLEEALEWLGSEELLEVTPKDFRIRRRDLKAKMRRRAEKELVPVEV
jgi:GTP-binding protein